MQKSTRIHNGNDNQRVAASALGFVVFMSGALLSSDGARAQVTPPPALLARRQVLADALTNQDFVRAGGVIKWPLIVDGSTGVRRMTPSAFASYMGGDPAALQCLRNAPLTQGTKRTFFGAKNWFATCNNRTYEFNRIRTVWRLTHILEAPASK